jgi:hypothetical protein
MGRRSASDECDELMRQFFDETESRQVDKIKQTRQPKRRAVLLSELDALDNVKAQYYNWSTGIKKA